MFTVALQVCIFSTSCRSVFSHFMSVLLVFIDESHKHTESSDIELPLFFVFVLPLNVYPC